MKFAAIGLHTGIWTETIESKPVKLETSLTVIRSSLNECFVNCVSMKKIKI